MKNFKKTRQKFVHIHFVTFLRVRRTFSGEGFKPPLPSPGYGLVHKGDGEKSQEYCVKIISTLAKI